MREKENEMDMPYEKFMRFGPEHLTESELLAIIIRTGTKDASALEVARKILMLARYPKSGLLGLYDLSLEEMMQVKGIGPVKAVKLKSLTELSMRMSRASQKEGVLFRDARTVAAYFMEELRHRDTECVILASLDGKGQLLAASRMSEGSAKMSLISPREIFLEALRQKAVSMILIHNHPSGDPTPSKADQKVTMELTELGEMMNIPLLDHVIIGDNRYVSFREMSMENT